MTTDLLFPGTMVAIGMLLAVLGFGLWQHRQQKLAALWSHVPGMVCRLRPDRRRTVEWISEGCRGLTGYRPAELVRNPRCGWGDLIHPQDRDAVGKTVAEALGGRRSFQAVYRIVTTAGQTRWVWEQGILARPPLGGNGVGTAAGSPAAVDSFVLDVTEWHRMQARTRQRDKMAAVSHLAANVAREVGNPLTAVSMLVQSLQRKVQGPPEEDRRDVPLEGGRRDVPPDGGRREDADVAEKLELVEEHLDRLNNIVRRLVDFAQPPRLERHECSINELVRDAVKVLRQDERAGQVAISYDLALDLPLARVAAEPFIEVMVQVGRYALDAVVAVADQRLPRIEVSSSCGASPHGRHLRIAYRDNGRGIAPEILPRIFEPFFTTKPVSRGAGLGLSACYNVVEQHGGTIHVDSRLGEGTCVVIEIPATERCRPRSAGGDRARV